MNANRIISMAFGLLAVGVLAVGWLLGLAPKLAEAARADADRALVESQNALHEARLAELASQYERIDELREELDELAEFIPAEHELEDFLDQLSADAATAGVTLSQVTMGEPASTGEEPGEGAALLAIPVTVTVIGALPATLDFTHAVQQADRVFVVSSLTYSEEGTALLGYLYVIAEPSVVTPAE